MTRDDDLLSRRLEGLLEGDEARALEARLAAEPALRARLDALRAPFPEDPEQAAPEALLPVAVPPGLGERVVRRLAAIGDDAALADHLEGLLDPGATAKLEYRLAAEPGLRARLDALEAPFPANPDQPAPVALPPVAVPDDLAWRVLARAEGAGLVRESADPTLAEHVEGLLEPGPAAALEGRMVSDRALAARREALARALPELPPVAAPPGLFERTLVRLEEEGLVTPGVDALPGALPAGLLDKTLGRLEAEGLVAPAAKQGVLLRFGRGPVALMAAAALLLCAVPSFLLGSHWQRGHALTAVADRDRQLDEVLDQVRRLRDEDAAQTAERAALLERLEQAGKDAELANEQRLIAEGKQKEFRLELEERDRKLVAREQELAQARAARPADDRQVAELSGRIGELEGRLASRDEELVDVKSELAQAQEALHQAQIEFQRLVDKDSTMQIADARRIDQWDPVRRQWLPLEGKAQLTPGDIVRGSGAQGSIELAAGRKLELRGGTYVIRGARRLDPIPEGGAVRAGPAAARTPQPAVLEERIPALIDQLDSGSAAERAEAQRQLVELWGRLPDPGPGVISRLAQATLRPDEVTGRPPASPRGWQSWWERVQEKRAEEKE